MDQRAAPAFALFRSAVQAEMLTIVLGDPRREWSTTELAYRLTAAVTTVAKEADRARALGLVSVRQEGSTRYLTAEHTAMAAALATLLNETLGPKHVLISELAGMANVHDAFIHADWARWYAGETLELADVDVIIIGSPAPHVVASAAARAKARLGREVNVIVRGLDWWKRVADGFESSRPLTRVWLGS